MKKLKKLPIVLALVVTMLAVACSEIDVSPRGEDEPTDPIVIKPTPNATSTDTTSITG